MRRHLAALGAVLRLAVRTAPAALLGCLLTAAAVAALPVAVAWLMKTVLDGLAAPHPTSLLLPVAGLTVAGTAAAVLPHVEQLMRGELSRRIAVEAQDRLYAAVNSSVGLGRFEDPALLDRLRLAQQCGQEAPPQIVMGAVGVLRTALTTAGFIASLAAISPPLALLVLLASAPALATEFRLSRAWVGTALRITPYERREMFYGQLLGDVQAAKELRLFGLGTHFRTRMRADRAVVDTANRRMEQRAALLQGAPALVSAAVAAAGLVWAVRAAARGELSVGDVSVFVAAVAAVQGGIGTAAALAALAQQKLALFGRYLDVLADPVDLPTLEPARQAPPLQHGIELRDVWFRYSDQHDWVLRGVDLTIPAGRSLALVGDNGAGKSTLVKLLLRFYDPTRGTVLWDGTDIRHFDPDELRARISAVFQDFMRYDLTAAENIALGDISATGPGPVRQAAAEAGADRLLQALPHGYDTMLSRSFLQDPDNPEEGVELSGGQWQRVALARAMMRRQPDLLILDEPTAGLDPAAEHEVQQLLRRHRHGRTGLLISHRLGTAREADLIAVLRNGTVAEHGTHAELIAADGRYATLFRQQAEGYTDSEATAPDPAPAPAGSAR
ncbi:ABC transporter ATP-binding protein [Kitasatospora sp. NPDC051914]|uniref:ABC transporter ATP-binding protein n=1 Tax=Kitasatospora sp. NPDC051914 TaxID=3154945 RepID=UPI003430EFD7